MRRGERRISRMMSLPADSRRRRSTDPRKRGAEQRDYSAYFGGFARYGRGRKIRTTVVSLFSMPPSRRPRARGVVSPTMVRGVATALLFSLAFACGSPPTVDARSSSSSWRRRLVLAAEPVSGWTHFARAPWQHVCTATRARPTGAGARLLNTPRSSAARLTR